MRSTHAQDAGRTRHAPDTFYDVAIVGFGPAGAVAAGLLGGMGLKVHVCDRQREVYDKPRAIAVDHEIMRVFQQLGLVERIAGYVEPFTPSEYFGVDGRLIKRLTMVEPPYPLGYTPSNVFTQPPVERILREHVQALPDVCVELGAALRSLEQDDAGVTLALDHDDGRRSKVRARYLVGCDGASSTVRDLVGIALEDLEFDEPWLVVDVLANERGLAKLPRTSVQYCEADRPCTLVIGPGNHRRWEISLRPGEDPQAATRPEETWKLLSRWLTPDDGELWRQASYRFHALVAGQWRKERVFIAGDAAHQQPPFLGQGMCQGVRDVANLSWKLASVLRGEAGGKRAEALLDSYGVERKQHVRTLTGRIKAIGAVICERDEARARERDARLLEECGGIVRDTPRQDVIPPLELGLLAPDASSARGTIFPQPWIRRAGGAAVRLDHHAGDGWWLVLAADYGGDAPPLPHAPQLALLRLGRDLEETEGVCAAWFARHQCAAAVVRPDRYVYGTAATAQELDALLETLRNKLH
ncbi:3-(3-hydroxy-phenyl)propionate/3-hydroxycinnamic acid hydroxylase [Pigmentiphaga humi]|uniref:3-(3-hydroxy-phenyl)propionate/3-hydroxycinnamic acid hydroxylase n=1 Tax=Pigmentiphaga humi TaxID=2478468 RepID=A0A3P4AYX8_9BURK|nr:bifunctional 3-(3-hydroxy-phenyl)propionate/3-hydroxycinnamic acid hydroxylase [Pigmentiphaga humi]VCU68972.1 3-(3-hydroxy-phenyl)propionate/3-hydroxycinnamic acid hydroxylase [Pigmentiphaga humi]